jgi:hypothetical protein
MSTPSTSGEPPVDRREDPPPTAAEQVEQAGPPGDEAQRQLQDTVRSVSRTEESN